MLTLHDFNKHRNDLPITKVEFVVKAESHQRMDVYAHHSTTPALCIYMPLLVVYVMLEQELPC